MIATDFDRTLVWEDGILRPRTIAALRLARDSGLHVIVVTGRMVQSVRRALEPADLGEPVICYQGAVVADGDGNWLRHVPIPLELAREAISFLETEGYDPNVYVERRALRRSRDAGVARVCRVQPARVARGR